MVQEEETDHIEYWESGNVRPMFFIGGPMDKRPVHRDMLKTEFFGAKEAIDDFSYSRVLYKRTRFKISGRYPDYVFLIFCGMPESESLEIAKKYLARY